MVCFRCGVRGEDGNYKKLHVIGLCTYHSTRRPFVLGSPPFVYDGFHKLGNEMG